MLIVLHEKINSIVPIQGISDNGDGSYRVDYLAEPTTEQLSLVNQAIADYPLLIEKDKKLQQINNQWIALEQTGWNSGQGFNLGITPSDVALLVGVYTLAKEASVLGLPIPAIIAIDNSSIQFATFAEMTTLMLRYGAARSEMSSSFAQKRKNVEAATTIEELEGIV
jgi:hypothetical protein